MLTTAEIMKKVRELEIVSKKLTTNLFGGEYHSAFKGKGMRFREVREYGFGDDIRFIDWNVSARYAHPYTKVFEEERELSVVLLVDVSASSLFGTIKQSKRDLITQIGAMLTFSAISNQDKVGVLFFSDRVEKYIAPAKGKDHALFIVRELLTFEPKQTGTDLSEAMKFFYRANRQKCIAFVLSDFVDGNFEHRLRVMARRHDVIGIRIHDKMEASLPPMGMVRLKDAESGRETWVDTGDPMVRHRYQQRYHAQAQHCKTVFTRAGADLLHLRTDEDHIKVLQQFFRRRIKAYKR